MPETNTPPLDSTAVSELLREIGARMELGGEAGFKARAYYNAAESLAAQPQPLAQIIAQGKLRGIPGVGEAIAEKIIKLHKTGTHPTLDFLREQMPAGVLDMLSIPGLGPKKAVTIYEALKIAGIAELEAACRAGKLADVKGIGASLQKKIIQGIEFSRKGEGLIRIDHAFQRAENARMALKKSHPEWLDIIPTGGVRRGCEVVEGISLVAITDAPAALETSAAIQIVQTEREHAGAALLFATGSQAHLDGLQKIAQAKGITLTAHGVFEGERPLPCTDETQIYAALGLPFIAPELREGRSEIECAQRGALPKLIELGDLRGILHCHTNFSDGSDTLEVMAESARKIGAEYFGVCDHSQSAAYAGGLRPEKVRAQHQLADGLNQNYAGKNFRIFKGIESDILEEGSLDYSDDVLDTFDFIVASVHSRFTLDKKAQTARLINAVSNPRTTILGHATGRLVLKREGYLIEVEDVLKACADHGVAVEINSDPHRLDLDWRWHERALELGCLLSINPDAHEHAGYENQKWGIQIARKGGVPPERVLNAMNLEAISKYFSERKRQYA